MASIAFCCHYCKSAFFSKDDVKIHWYRDCMHRCNCINSNTPIHIRYDAQKHQFLIYFNRTNLHTPLDDIQHNYFPNIALAHSAYKRFKVDEDQVMMEV
jgi:hypothetical protein